MSLFLLFMQQESVRHALEHLGARLSRIEHSVLERPTGDTCAECELLASGAASIPASLPPAVRIAPTWTDVPAPVERPFTAASQYYQSRAPPAVLLLA